MNIVKTIQEEVVKAVKDLYDGDFTPDSVTVNTTKKEFDGDYTVVVFPYARVARKKPEQIGEDIGNYVTGRLEALTGFNVVKGFLNFSISDTYWKDLLKGIYENENFGQQPKNGKKVMVEFASPNTNKPLHLGHIRNILLGWSVSQLLETAGYEVIKTQIINDRGIQISKSMLAWQKHGNGDTPESTGIKGDHFVGKYYVLYDQHFQKEYAAWQASGEGKAVYEKEKEEGQTEKDFFKKYKNTYANTHSKLGKAAQDMLVKWEAGDPEIMALWRKMRDWVLEGFDETYKKLGVYFDKEYFESETYLLGKATVEEGIEKGVFKREADNSVSIDLTDVGMDKKTVMRSDGTSLYVTQDIGTAKLRYKDYGVEKMVYVVGDEQIYHFQVLFEVLKRFGEPYADGVFHLAYGMIDLPEGRMKSREGKVVDADDLVAEVVEEARKNAAERAETADLNTPEQQEIIRKIGIAALKFFIIKVNPFKRMTFNPAESVDLQGQTGPYVQNAYVRIQSILRKVGKADLAQAQEYTGLGEVEKAIVKRISELPDIIKEAAEKYDPSTIANYCYRLAQDFHRFYHDFSIIRAESEAAKHFRLALSESTAKALRLGMKILGIEMPEKM